MTIQKELVAIPDIKTIQLHPETFERLLVVALLKSINFYRVLRGKICPYNPQTQSFRPDFAVQRYNKLYIIVDSWWSKFDKLTLQRDLWFPSEHLENYLVDRARKGLITLEEAQMLNEELKFELERLEFTPELYQALYTCEAFGYWLEARAATYEVNQLGRKFSIKPATHRDLQEAADRIKQSIAPVKNNIVNGGDVMLKQVSISKPISTGLPLMDAALGGGVRPCEATIIAAINGGGKSIMTMQLALGFAMQRINTVIFTTEEPPENLILKAISNFTNTDYSEFTNRRAVRDLQPDQTIEAGVIPQHLWENPEVYDRLVELYNMFKTHIAFVNWAEGQGYSIQSNYNAELEKLEQLGWKPQVTMFDWIGGGLRKNVNPEHKRHDFQDAVDHIVDDCKATRRISFLMAQLDKNKCKGTTKKVTMDMLSENKTMTNNVTNFIGISSLRSADDSEGKPRLQARQWLHADKARQGQGGLVAVRARFQFQRFASDSMLRMKGGQLEYN